MPRNVPKHAWVVNGENEAKRGQTQDAAAEQLARRAQTANKLPGDRRLIVCATGRVLSIDDLAQLLAAYRQC